MGLNAGASEQLDEVRHENVHPVIGGDSSHTPPEEGAVGTTHSISGMFQTLHINNDGYEGASSTDRSDALNMLLKAKRGAQVDPHIFAQGYYEDWEIFLKLIPLEKQSQFLRG